jgi:hypothetical protein
MAVDTNPGTASVTRPRRRTTLARIGIAVLLAAAITAGLAVWGRTRTPDYTFSFFGQTGLTQVFSLKSLLATVVLGLAGVQVLLALWMYGKLPGLRNPPRAAPITHRVSGVLLILITLPIAVHCLAAYGVQFYDLRVTVHSLAGCFLYGAFAAKVLLVRSRRLPRWVLPVAGGLLAVTVAVLWYTAALWYYNGYHVPGLP